METALTPEYATRSYWLGLTPYTPNPPLPGDCAVDVAIVGGGFTGFWTAVALKQAEPNCTVAVLEREVVGYGASGRNGGFAITLVDRSLTDLVRHVGRAEALPIHAAVARSVSTLKPFLDAHGVDCDAMPNGMLVVSTSPEQDARVAKEMDTLIALGIEGVRFLDRPAIQEEIHSETFRCGIEDRTCTLVDPAKLVRGLKRLAVDLGVQVFEGTGVQRVEDGADGVRLQTPRGLVSADRAVLCLNAFSRFFPELRRYLLNFYTYILLTAPLTDEQWRRIGWRSRRGVEDKRTFLHYPRPTVDGRILWGGWKTPLRSDGPHPKYDRDEEIFRGLERTFRWTFPQLNDVEFTHAWGGPLAITARFMPAVGWLKGRRIAYGFGYNGHGVAPSRLVGEILRDPLLERKTEIADLLFVRRKPLPLPGGALRNCIVRSAMNALHRVDEAGRPEPLPVRLLGRLFG